METIKKMLLTFVVNTLVMLISLAGSSLLIFGAKVLKSPEATLVKILSLHSYIAVMFCYAFYLVFDLCEHFLTHSGSERTTAPMSKEFTKEYSESKVLLRLVVTRAIKVIGACLIFGLVFWFLWLGEYAFGSFLMGAALGLLAFLISSFLRHRLTYRQVEQNLTQREGPQSLTNPEEIRPKAPVED